MITETVLATQIDQDLYMEFGDESALCRYLLGNSAWDYCQAYQLKPFLIMLHKNPIALTVDILVRVTAPATQLTWLRLNIDGNREFG